MVVMRPAWWVVGLDDEAARDPPQEPEEDAMSRLGKIAEIPAGSWTKWVVVGFWVLMLVILFPLSAKLQGAEKNDAK